MGHQLHPLHPLGMSGCYFGSLNDAMIAATTDRCMCTMAHAAAYEVSSPYHVDD